MGLKSTVFFVEKLTLRTWFLSIFPRLFRPANWGPRVRRCYVIDASRPVLLAVQAAGRVLGVKVEKISFRFTDVQDEQGTLIEERQRYVDLFEVQRQAFVEPIWNRLLQEYLLKGPFKTFLEKSLVSSLRRKILLVQICAWYSRKLGGEEPVVLFTERQPWLRAVGRYASGYGVRVVGTPSNWELRRFLDSLLGPRGIDLLRALRDVDLHVLDVLSRRCREVLRYGPIEEKREKQKVHDRLRQEREVGPKVAVQRFSGINLDHPEFNSDLFFWQQSSLPGSDILVLSTLPIDPQDEESLSRHGLRAVVLSPGSAAGTATPLLSYWRDFKKRAGRLDALGRSMEARWLRGKASQYETKREYRTRLFSKYNVKVYCSWYRFDEEHCVISDALRALGGVTAIYPRAYSSNPSPLTAINVDICFSYSSADAQLECSSGSVIAYHVATGYIGDHRFRPLRTQADAVRRSIKQRGATHLLAYFDENSLDDSRWHSGHEFMRVNYEFLLTKVLAEPWLGLLIKPKVPGTLRRRLGSVADLLRQAEETGRCYVYEAGSMGPAYPPAAAALAADLVVHGHLNGGTAGVEAALAGVPTLLLDREGSSSFSPLYRLGVGRVVFTDWEVLWKACLEHWGTPSGVPGFGDWSLMLDELDPFRDGRAAERMGTYIKWLIDGFKAGLDRETIMADAAERYCKQWGWDKVTEVNGRSWPGLGRTGYPLGGPETSASI